MINISFRDHRDRFGYSTPSESQWHLLVENEQTCTFYDKVLFSMRQELYSGNGNNLANENARVERISLQKWNNKQRKCSVPAKYIFVKDN